MRNLIRAISYFLMYLREYDSYMWFKMCHLTEEQRKDIECADASRGVEAHDENRFAYAWNLTKIWWKHRDKYSHKCTGDCEACTNTHC